MLKYLVLIYLWITISHLFIFLSTYPPNIWASGVFNKNRLRKYTIIGDKQLQKKECDHFEQRSTHQAKALCNLCGWLEWQQGALRSFFRVLPTKIWSALEQSWKKYIQEQQSNQFQSYNQSMGFAKRMDQNTAKHRIGTRMKKWWWYPFVFLMVDVVLQGAWVLYCIKKDKGNEFLPLLASRRDAANAIFLEHSKEGKLSQSHIGIPNIPSDVCYDDTKYC